MPSREEAWKLLTEYVESESLRKHCLAVEAAMRAYAQKFSEDSEKWGVVGLLHDFDYEKYPDEHPAKGSQILKERGYPQDVITAILSHNERSGVPRGTKMAQVLFAVDELCGMVMATAYVRPAGLDGMTPKSVKKNLKKKSFAAAINREEIEQGRKELDVEEDNHVALVIEAMRGIKKELGF